MIYFIKYQLNIFPYEINNLISQYFYENYLDDIKISREKIFYFKNIKLPSLHNIYIDKYTKYDNEELEEIIENKKTEQYNYNDFFQFNLKEQLIIQHFENVIYRKRLLSFSNFLIRINGKLRYLKLIFLYKSLIKELIKSNWGLNYNIDNLQQYIIHKDYDNYKINDIININI